MKRSSIVADECADIVGPKDGEKKMKLASIDTFVKERRELNRVDGSTGGGDGDGQRSGFGKIESKAT